MAATFSWAGTNGAPPGVITLLGSSGNLADFKNIDSTGIADYATNPIPAGSNSYEIWLRGWFSGVFNKVSDLRFWMSTDYSPNTGLTVKVKTTQTIYNQPTNISSSIAITTIGTSDPGSQNVSVEGNLNGSLIASGYTDYVVLQLQTTTGAAAGDTSLAAFSLSYIES